MDLMKETINAMQHIARQYSEGREIDKYWKAILPELYGIANNEIFLALHRDYINEPMKQSAFKFAQTLPPRDINNLDFAALMLHSETRHMWLGISDDSTFQSIVDENHGVIYNTTDPTRWVKPSIIWIPYFEAIIGQVYHSLVKLYEEYFFAQRCYTALIRRARKNPYVKHTFIQLTKSADLYHLRKKGSKWLHENSRRIATSVGAQPEVGEDVKQDWLAELLSLPMHRQIQEVRSTGIEIKHRAYDIQHRKGGQHKPIHFDDLDDGLINNMPDKSTIGSDEDIDVEVLLPRLQSRRSQIEKILSKGKSKLGKRRFKVMEMLAHTPCQQTIAKALNVSEGTITGDIQIIKKARDRIKEILYN